MFGPLWQFSRGSRSAGGSHTLTQNRRRIRVAPLSSAYSPEPYTTPPSRIRSVRVYMTCTYVGEVVLCSCVICSGRHEVEITGHNGHIYKGRASKLPPLKVSTHTHTHLNLSLLRHTYRMTLGEAEQVGQPLPLPTNNNILAHSLYVQTVHV